MHEGFIDAYSTMQEEFSNVYSDVKDVRTELKSDIKEDKMTLENDTNKNINLLVEGQQNLNAKIDEVLKFESEKELLTIP
jgi:adenylosuccinate synthase